MPERRKTRRDKISRSSFLELFLPPLGMVRQFSRDERIDPRRWSTETKAGTAAYLLGLLGLYSNRTDQNVTVSLPENGDIIELPKHPLPPDLQFSGDPLTLLMGDYSLLIDASEFKHSSFGQQSILQAFVNPEGVREMRALLGRLGVSETDPITYDLNQTNVTYSCTGQSGMDFLNSSQGAVDVNHELLLAIVYKSFGYDGEDLNDPMIRKRMYGHMSGFLQQWLYHETLHRKHTLNGTEQFQAELESIGIESDIGLNPVMVYTDPFSSDFQMIVGDEASSYRSMLNTLYGEHILASPGIDYPWTVEGALKPDYNELYRVWIEDALKFYKYSGNPHKSAYLECPVLDDPRVLFQ